MDKENKKIPLGEILKTLLVFIIAFTVIIFVAKAINSLFVEKEPETKPVREIVECPENFISYQKLAENPKSVVRLISEKTPMYAENEEFKSKIVITKIETEKSKVACGYLLIHAGTNTNGPLQSWENLYINPNEFGGHIDSKNNKGAGDSSTYSEYLFPLSKMEYWKTRNDRVNGNLLTADWGVLLNVSKTISFDIGLNTNDKTGFISEFSIAYKCWDPATGKENFDCSIEVVK